MQEDGTNSITELDKKLITPKAHTNAVHADYQT